jgi:putative FmdB family regulatory protein
MPIFEYRCSTCDHRFETLVRGADTPTCPACDGEDLVKQLSTFAVGGGPSPSRSLSAGSCTTCGDPRGAGACALN